MCKCEHECACAEHDLWYTQTSFFGKCFVWKISQAKRIKDAFKKLTRPANGEPESKSQSYIIFSTKKTKLVQQFRLKYCVGMIYIEGTSHQEI